MDFSQATQSYNIFRHMANWEADCDVTTALRQIFSAGVIISSSVMLQQTILDLAFLCYVIGSANLRQFINQSNSN